jgi:hypothetical protein
MHIVKHELCLGVNHVLVYENKEVIAEGRTIAPEVLI